MTSDVHNFDSTAAPEHPSTLAQIIGNRDLIILVISLVLLIASASFVFESANKRMYWLYDDTEHLNAAYNLFHGRGLTIDFIDHEAAFRETNVPALNQYEQISHPLQNKGPLHIILLGAWLILTGAYPVNWLFWGNILNFMFAASFVVVFYFFTKHHFGQEIAMYSTPVIALMPALIWFSVRIRPEVLAYVLMAASLYFAAERMSTRNVASAGLLTALAHLAHPIGLLTGSAHLIFLLIKKNFKAALLLVAIWATVLTPWMVRNYIVFGDATQGLGIPIPKRVLIAAGLISNDAVSSKLVNPDDLSSITAISPFDTLNGMVNEFSNLYGMPFFLLFISLGILAYLLVPIIKKAMLVNSLHINMDTLILLVIFGAISLGSYLMFAQVTGRVTPEIRMIVGSMYMLVPLAILGIRRMIGMLVISKNKQYIVTASTISIITVFSLTQLATGITAILAYQEDKYENAYDKLMHQWMRENIPADAKIASDLPHGVVLRTGHPSVNFYYEFKDDVPYEKWIIKKFDIDYLVFYFGEPLTNTDLGEIHLKEVYNSGENIIYQVIE